MFFSFGIPSRTFAALLAIIPAAVCTVADIIPSSFILFVFTYSDISFSVVPFSITNTCPSLPDTYEYIIGIFFFEQYLSIISDTSRSFVQSITRSDSSKYAFISVSSSWNAFIDTVSFIASSLFLACFALNLFMSSCKNMLVCCISSSSILPLSISLTPIPARTSMSAITEPTPASPTTDTVFVRISCALSPICFTSSCLEYLVFFLLAITLLGVDMFYLNISGVFSKNSFIIKFINY